MRLRAVLLSDLRSSDNQLVLRRLALNVLHEILKWNQSNDVCYLVLDEQGGNWILFTGNYKAVESLVH